MISKKIITMAMAFFFLFSLSTGAVEDENVTDEGDVQITGAEPGELDEEDIQELKDYVKSELGNSGITPDSPFYAANGILDMFKSNERIANERAAAVASMAEQGNEEHIERAMEAYEEALERRSTDSNKSEDDAEAVAEQNSKHLEVMSRVRSRVPEEARGSIDRAMEKSAEGRERSIDALTEKNPERGQEVAQRTLERVMEKTPEEAQQGLQRAFENVQNRMGKGPGEMSGGMPGNRSDLPGEADQMPGDDELPGEADQRPGDINGSPEDMGEAPGDEGGAPEDADAEIPEQDQPTGNPQ